MPGAGGGEEDGAAPPVPGAGGGMRFGGGSLPGAKGWPLPLADALKDAASLTVPKGDGGDAARGGEGAPPGPGGGNFLGGGGGITLVTREERVLW